MLVIAFNVHDVGNQHVFDALLPNPHVQQGLAGFVRRARVDARALRSGRRHTALAARRVDATRALRAANAIQHWPRDASTRRALNQTTCFVTKPTFCVFILKNKKPYRLQLFIGVGPPEISGAYKL